MKKFLKLGPGVGDGPEGDTGAGCEDWHGDVAGPGGEVWLVGGDRPWGDGDGHGGGDGHRSGEPYDG